MTDKRRGLGRGLGALIPPPPTGPATQRPSDVFFPSRGDGFTGNGAGIGDSDRSQLRQVPGASFAQLNISDIVANSRQPRQVFDDDDLAELTASIAEIGVLQPIVVRPVAVRTTDAGTRPEPEPQYELIMGERRLRASTAAGKLTVPAIIRDTADDDMLRDALLENLHRSQLNAL
ncbi:MAG: ParB/RepB/Spo0J family partition protein, partial [Allobranchiibius sp.]